MDRKRHWDGIYATKKADHVSWFQPRASLSLELILSNLPDRGATILDVGGGASTLVDGLLDHRFARVAVLDLSHLALAQARQRIGPAAEQVSWVEGDILAAPLAEAVIDLWHDRAVFHFLTELEDRARYVAAVRHAVRPGGLVLVATFAEDGPTHCSGLEVARYDAEELHASFGAGFELITARREVHHTPAGTAQAFTYCLCRFAPQAEARPAAQLKALHVGAVPGAAQP